jgi:purine-binding chemotaxis protein CheW
MTMNRRLTDYEHTLDADTPAGGADTQQFVYFTIGDQHCCVDIMSVREIRAWAGTTSLPNSAPYIRGVINLRGVILPVIDLRIRFGQGESQPTAGNVIIVVAIGETLNGLLVDGVSDILTVQTSSIAPIPELEGEDRNPFFRGLITGQENLMAIIALDQLVAQRIGDQPQNSAAA